MGKIILSCMRFHTTEHKKTVNNVKKFLHQKGVEFLDCSPRLLDHKKTKGSDLIITLGGDGTFLRASHYLPPDARLVGINTHPAIKEGFFTSINNKDFKDKLTRLFKKDYTIKKLTRLDTWVGRLKVEPALNEVYFGSEKPYAMSRYIIRVNGKEEFQKSSGVLVGTAAGSFAWINSVGAKTITIDSKRIQYCPREVYTGKLTPAKLLGGFVQSDKVELVPVRIRKSIVVIDSLSQEYHVKEGTKVVIKKSTKPINMVVF